MYKSVRSISQRGQKISLLKVAQYAVPFFVLIGASVGLIFATGNGSIITDTLSGIIPTFDNSEMNDPFSGKSQTPHWPPDGKGLKVTIINALSDEWQTTFSLASADWDFGDPDAVNIFEEAGTYDPDCEAPDGKVIVCNGDYGDTKWRGINEAMLDAQGNIISSSARMNEYYLLNMDLGAWQYTMCHELGKSLLSFFIFLSCCRFLLRLAQ